MPGRGGRGSLCGVCGMVGTKEKRMRGELKSLFAGFLSGARTTIYEKGMVSRRLQKAI